MQPFSESENRSSQEIEGDFTNFLTVLDFFYPVIYYNRGTTKIEEKENPMLSMMPSQVENTEFFSDLKIFVLSTLIWQNSILPYSSRPQLSSLADEPVRYFPAFEKALNTVFGMVVDRSIVVHPIKA